MIYSAISYRTETDLKKKNILFLNQYLMSPKSNKIFSQCLLKSGKRQLDLVKQVFIS